MRNLFGVRLAPFRLVVASFLFAVVLMMSDVALAEPPVPEPFGQTADGKPVEIYTLQNKNGVKARIMTRGATLVSLEAPDKAGNLADIILGFDDVAGYEGDGNQYFGCTTGRVCNRIAKGKFTLGGKEYSLAINNEPNSLHGGGSRSLDKVVWKASPTVIKETPGVRFRYTSPDGEEGYPGTVKFVVTYSLNDENELSIKYTAETDHTTPINVTNHAYFNLGGAGSATALDHHLLLKCDQYTPNDETLIPTGQLASVADTPLDFRKSTRIGDRISQLDESPNIGYDHNFVINGDAGNVRTAAVLKDPASGRVLTVKTDQPGIQFYSGNFLKGQTGKGDKTYPHRSAVCLETQHFPDSVNHPEFPTTLVQPLVNYRHTCIYQLSVE